MILTKLLKPRNLFLTLLFCSLLFSVIRFSLEKQSKEVLGELISITPYTENYFEATNSLDAFITKFISSDYRVDDSGVFGYIYDDIDNGTTVKKNGVISLESSPESTYFKRGEIASFDYSQKMKIVWDKFDRKYVLFKDSKEYLLVNTFYDFYYRSYLGQHILQDFVQDYLKNKEFITPQDENTWLWQWYFYTPVDSGVQHSMQAKVFVNPDTKYIEKIKLFDNGKEISVFEFTFEKIEDFSIKSLLSDYVQIEE